MIYPWQQSQWTQLQSMRTRQRLPHALLIQGKRGIGIHEFCLDLAASVLCQNNAESGEACQQCSSCQLFLAGTHPDLKMIKPEEEGKAIKIDQIRELLNFTQLQSHFDQTRVVLIYPAEAMNKNAANSLLKTLEEPPGDCLLILASYESAILPATIRSRCQKLELSATSEQLKTHLKGELTEEQIEVLIASSWGPLLAEEVGLDQLIDPVELLADLEAINQAQQEPMATAENWAKADEKQLIHAQIKLCEELLRIRSQAPSGSRRLNDQAIKQRLTQLGAAYDLKGIFQIYDKLIEYYKLLSFNSNLKVISMMEDVAIDWLALKRR